jgi:UDP-N-acetylmuramoyl-tripeptide--D-alanyl-D-alanine ligase
LAAAAAAVIDGIDVADVATALSEAQIPTRLTHHRGVNGSLIIDDTYNASPASMRAALDLLGEVPGRKVAVLGDMRELGGASLEGHRDVGRRAAEVADVIFAVGELGRWIGDAAIEAGHRDVVITMDKDDVTHALVPQLGAGDVVLLKGSGALALETLVEGLKADA